MIENQLRERLTHLLNKVEYTEHKLSGKKFIACSTSEYVNQLHGEIRAIQTELRHWENILFEAENMSKDTLHLIVTKRWFDLISANDKKAEYRDITDYWLVRLVKGDSQFYTDFSLTDFKRRSRFLVPQSLTPKHEWKTVTFRNGYGKDVPTVTFEFKGLSLGNPKKEWFPFENIESLGIDFEEWAKTHLFFTIELGEKIK